MTQKFVVCNLEFECTRIPSIVKSDVIRVNERQFFVCLVSLETINKEGEMNGKPGDLAARMFCELAVVINI